MRIKNNSVSNVQKILNLSINSINNKKLFNINNGCKNQ